MKIALLTDGIFPYVIGGMQRHSFYLAKYLASSGIQVDLYHMNQSEKDIHRLDVFSEEEKKNIRSFVIEFPRFSGIGHYIRESYEYSRRIYEVFRKQGRADFIYAKGFSGWELLNRKKQGEDLPPVGVNFHGYEMYQPAPSFIEQLKYSFLLRSPVKFNMEQADYLFSYGGKITALLESLGVPGKKIIEIPAGIDPGWLADKAVPKSSKIRFIFLGRFERRKGLPELYKALRSLPAGLDFSFDFIGDIPSAKRIGGDRYHYEGKITDSNKLRPLMRAADVLVCPSLSEGMPNVILEAMASGLAVIATNVGAVGVAVNETNGWLIPPGDITALANSIRNACEISGEMLLSKKTASLTSIKEKFLWEKIGAKTVAEISKRLES